MIDIKRWDTLLLIIFFIVFVFLFSKCTIKCGANSDPYKPLNTSSLSSMGWISGRPTSYAVPESDFGDLSLYYIEKPVTASEAYGIANSLRGVIASKNCINKILRRGEDMVMNTPTIDGLFYKPDPAESGFLVTGRISRILDAKLVPDEVLHGEENAVRNGIIMYGPVPKGIGKVIISDRLGRSSYACVDAQLYIGIRV